MSETNPTVVWQPPNDFRLLESRVEGITVYAPAPKEDLLTGAPVTFTCPSCGASTHYDVAAGGVACEHCGFTIPLTTEKVGRRAVEEEFTLEALAKAQHGWGISREELYCDSCGAILTVPTQALTATCPFCASNKVNLRAPAADQLRPGFVIPFKIEAGTVRQNAAAWLGKGWFHPDGLAASAGLDHFRGVYLPYWTFDAGITADWAAEVGYERQERYYDAGSKEWHTRTEIDWRPESGRAELSIDDYLVPGTARASQVILGRIHSFSMADLRAYTPDCLAGWQAQAYDVNLPAAWERGKAVLREQAKDACMAQIPTSHVRNFRMSADFSGETWRYVLLPVYVAAYRYEGRAYQVMANGQTGQVDGQKPVAWWKVWLAVAALLLPGVLLGLISLPLLLAGGVGMITLVLGGILLAVGGIFAYRIYRQALESEAL